MGGNSTNCDLLGALCVDALQGQEVTGDNIITACWMNTVIGLLCLLGYVIWRSSPTFKIYNLRLYAAGVKRRPPPLRNNGFHRIFSWMWPLWGVSDKEFLASAGFDSFVAVRVIALGIGIFLPLTILGVGVLLPVNYNGGYLNDQEYEGGDSNTTLVFQKMTISNIPDGSPLLWIHWTFMLIFVGWTCYLLLAFYEEHIAMCHTIASGRLGGERFSKKGDHKGSSDENGSESGEHTFSEDEKPSLDNSPAAGPALADASETGPSRNNFGPALADASETGPSRNNFGLPGLDTQEQYAGAGLGDRKPGYYELWPTRRGDPPELAASRPPHAGQYTVIVTDEPTRHFKIRDAKVMGIPLRLTRVDSLQASQAGTDMQSNWYWLGGAVSAKRFSGQKKAEAQGALEEDGMALDVNGDAEGMETAAALPWENAVTKKSKAAVAVGARMRVVAATFKRLFGDDFDCVVPVYDTRAIDSALTALYGCQARLARAELALGQAQAAVTANPDNAKASGKLARAQAAIKKLQDKESEMQAAAAALADNALNSTPCPSFIAVFRTAKAAAMAAELNINPVNWRGMHIHAGVDPENINWTALQRSWWSRHVRSAISIFAIVLIMLFPLGAITGAFSQLEAALCGTDGSAKDSWFCSDNMWATFFRNVLTGVLPSIVMAVYQAVVLPIYIYTCTLAESRHVSLSDMEARCADLFFHWNWSNFFLQTMLGGTIINGLRAAIDDPSSIIDLLGTAVPAASNFFINYVLYMALAMSFFRLFWPHGSVLGNILQWLHILPKPKTAQDIASANPLRNCRFSRDIGVSTFAIYVAAIGYAVIAPFIVPVALIYFTLMIFIWRNQQLYVFQSAYNSRGHIWRFTAHRIVACLAIMVLFTSAMFFVKGAFIQGALGLVFVEIFLIAFDKYLTQRYDSIFESMPVVVLEAAPRVDLDPDLYVQPPLRQGAEGWYLEYGKAWQGWGMSRYGL